MSSDPSNKAASPVSLTIHTGPEPDVNAARTRSGRWQALAVVVICALPVIASYFAYYTVKLSGKAYSDLVTPTVDLPATLTLTDLSGKRVDPASLKGQWLLTVVQPAACDKACEDQLFMQRQLREMLGKERDKVDKLWLIPDDAPLRPELQAVMNQPPTVTVLRVPREELQAWLAPAPGHVLQDHIYLVDPMGRWMLRAQANPDPAKLKSDLAKLMKANAGWDQPGR